MSNWIYSIAFRIAGMGQVSAAEQTVRQLDNAIDQAGASAVNTSGRFDKMGKRGRATFAGLVSSARRWIGVMALAGTTMASINAAASNDATNIAIDFATSGDGVRNVQFVEEVSNRLGTNLLSGREGFKQLSSSMRGTQLEGAATRDIFEGVAMAGGAMRLSADQIKGAYLAIGQIASKGKVQAEELRGQLGERIPGAFKIASDAMGVTQADLNKMLEAGEVMAEDFLPKFAAQLKTTFGSDAARVAQGPAAAMERMRNEVYELQVAFGEQLLPVVQMLLQDYLIPAISYISEHIELFMTLAAAVTGLWVVNKAYALGLATVRTALGLTKVAQIGLNLVMRANPIGLVVTALGALAGAAIWVVKNFEKVKKAVSNAWGGIKRFGQRVASVFVSPVTHAMNAAKAAVERVQQSVASGERAAQLTRLHQELGQRNASAYSNGFRAVAKQNFAFDRFGIMRPNLPEGVLNPRFLPGGNRTNPDETPIADLGGNSSQAGLAGVIGGKEKTINISLGSLIADLQIVSQTMEQGTDEMIDLVTRKLVQVLNTANQVQ